MTLTPSRGTLITRRAVQLPRHAAEAHLNKLFQALRKPAQDEMLYRAALRAAPAMAHLPPARMYQFWLDCLRYVSGDGKDLSQWPAREREFREWVRSTGGDERVAVKLLEQLALDEGRSALNAKGAERDAASNANVEAIATHRTPLAQQRHEAELQDQQDRRASIEAAIRKHNPGYLTPPVTAAAQATERQRDIVASIDQLQSGFTRIVEDRSDLRGGADMQNDIRNAMEQLGTDFGDSHEVAHFTETTQPQGRAE